MTKWNDLLLICEGFHLLLTFSLATRYPYMGTKVKFIFGTLRFLQMRSNHAPAQLLPDKLSLSTNAIQSGQMIGHTNSPT